LAKLYLSPSSITWGSEHAVGDTFEVQVRIADVVDCYAVQFGVTWDSTVLELTDAVKGDFLEAAGVSTWWFPSITAGQTICSYMRFQAASGVNVPATDGLVATLKFKALKANASTKISFVDADCAWYDSAFNEYAFTELQPATFTFGVPPAVGYPKMVIVNVSAPTQASEGETFEVTVDWRNDGETGKAYTRIIDLETGLDVSPRTEFDVAKNQEGETKYLILMPNKSLKLRLELGHVE
jgi:hypothetical protein